MLTMYSDAKVALVYAPGFAVSKETLGWMEALTRAIFLLMRFMCMKWEKRIGCPERSADFGRFICDE